MTPREEELPRREGDDELRYPDDGTPTSKSEHYPPTPVSERRTQLIPFTWPKVAQPVIYRPNSPLFGPDRLCLPVLHWQRLILPTPLEALSMHEREPSSASQSGGESRLERRRPAKGPLSSSPVTPRRPRVAQERHAASATLYQRCAPLVEGASSSHRSVRIRLSFVIVVERGESLGVTSVEGVLLRTNSPPSSAGCFRATWKAATCQRPLLLPPG